MKGDAMYRDSPPPLIDMPRDKFFSRFADCLCCSFFATVKRKRIWGKYQLMSVLEEAIKEAVVDAALLEHDDWDRWFEATEKQEQEWRDLDENSW